MAEYRDEKENLRRRVAELERLVGELEDDDLADDDSLRAAREELRQAERERDELADDVEALTRERDRLQRKVAARDEKDRPSTLRSLRKSCLRGAVFTFPLGVILNALDAALWSTSLVLSLAMLFLVVGVVLSYEDFQSLADAIRGKRSRPATWREQGEEKDRAQERDEKRRENEPESRRRREEKKGRRARRARVREESETEAAAERRRRKQKRRSRR